MNALLHHLDLPAMSAESMEGEEMADDDGDDVDGDAEGSGAGEGDGDVANGGNTPGLSWQGSGAFGRRGAAADGPAEAPVRPGIVHRIDKGTSGLLVVAKDDFTLVRGCSFTVTWCGCPCLLRCPSLRHVSTSMRQSMLRRHTLAGAAL